MYLVYDTLCFMANRALVKLDSNRFLYFPSSHTASLGSSLLCLVHQLVCIVPFIPLHVLSDFVHLLRDIKHVQVDLDNLHGLAWAQGSVQSTLERHGHLAYPDILIALCISGLILWRRGVDKDKGTGIFKRSCHGHSFEEQLLALRVYVRALSRVTGEPERWTHDDACPVGNERPTCLREGQVPAHDQPHATPGRVERCVRRLRVGREMRPLRVPQVLLLIPRENIALWPDEVACISQRSRRQWLQQRARDDGDAQLLCERLVALQILG